MKIADFKVEQWMNAYEGSAIYNMTDTCVSSFTYEQLLSMDEHHLLKNIKLDYGTITGDIRLKEEILKLYATGTTDSITIAQGCLQANEMVMETILDPGDRVIAYTPSYQQFTGLPRSIGCKVIELSLHEDSQWQPDLSSLQEAFEQPVKLVIINHPNNPTGTIAGAAYLKELFALCKKYGTYIMSDEVYRSPEIPSISDLYDRGISTSSLSKMFSLAGLRLGWVKGPQEIIDAINVRRDYTIISTGPLADTLGIIALQHSSSILARSHDIIARNQATAAAWLKNNPGFHLVMPQAGTVSFLQYDGEEPSEDFAKNILNKYGVFYVPGSCFDCEHHLRLGFTADADAFEKGLQLTSEYYQSTH